MLDSPTLWTPKLVDDILIEAFETLRAIGGRPGPKSFGSNWPAIVREAADLKDLLEDATGFSPSTHYKVRVITRDVGEDEPPEEMP